MDSHLTSSWPYASAWTPRSEPSSTTKVGVATPPTNNVLRRMHPAPTRLFRTPPLPVRVRNPWTSVVPAMGNSPNKNMVGGFERDFASTVESLDTWLGIAPASRRTLSVPLPLTWKGTRMSLRTRTRARLRTRIHLRTLPVAVAVETIGVVEEPAAKASREMPRPAAA